MKITRITIKNFLTISEADLALSDKGLVLLQGQNLDDPSAKSNGAGKSSIPDALCWCLYGETARGVTGDAVVNKVAKKNCMVSVELEDGDDRYKVMRFRKDKHDKNALLVFKGSKDPGEEGVDLSKGTDRETQEVVNTVVGSTVDVFRSSVYAGQEAMPDLPGMTDKFLKLLIEEAAGVERLAKAYDLARAAANTEETALQGARSLLKLNQERMDELKHRLDVANVQFSDFEAARANRRHEEAKLASGFATEAKAVEVAIIGLNEPALKAEADEISAKLEERDKQERELEALAADVSKRDREFTRAMSEVDRAKKEHDRAGFELDNIDKKVGQPCGECGKPYCEHDIEDARKIAKAKVEAAKSEVMKMAHRAKSAKVELESATKAHAIYKAGMGDFTKLIARQREITITLSSIYGLKSDYESAKASVTKHVELAKAAMTETNPYKSLVDSLNAEIVNIDGNIKALEGQIADREEIVEDQLAAVAVFGPAGVRARILDTVTPFLNERTSEYLGALSDGNISAVWSTLTRTKGGDLKEKFAIEVSNDKGAESFAGLSGGEKRKVRLATTLALQDLVATRATKPIDLFIGDEIDDALDVAGLERLMTILERKARERGTVLVISHNDLADWVDNIATVTKKGGVSTVDGALT